MQVSVMLSMEFTVSMVMSRWTAALVMVARCYQRLLLVMSLLLHPPLGSEAERQQVATKPKSGPLYQMDPKGQAFSGCSGTGKFENDEGQKAHATRPSERHRNQAHLPYY